MSGKRNELIKPVPIQPTTTTAAMVRWFTYSVVFALLPVAIAVALRGLAGKLSLNDLSASPEFLFLAIMLNATALADLSEFAPAFRREPLYQALHSALLLCAVVAAIFYGCLVFQSVFEVTNQLFRWRLMIVSFVLDGVSLLLTTTVELLLAKIRA